MESSGRPEEAMVTRVYVSKPSGHTTSHEFPSKGEARRFANSYQDRGRVLWDDATKEFIVYLEAES